eukprot:6145824-Pleurochrysis_carterae.AAC.3
MICSQQRWAWRTYFLPDLGLIGSYPRVLLGLKVTQSPVVAGCGVWLYSRVQNVISRPPQSHQRPTVLGDSPPERSEAEPIQPELQPGDVFEICEADLRAIIAALNSSHMGTHEVERLADFKTILCGAKLLDQFW